MTQPNSASSPLSADAARAGWESFTWLMVSKETLKRGFFPHGAYDEKGILKQSACPNLHKEVHTKCDIQAYYSSSNFDAMPVIKLKNGIVVIEWTTAKQAERLQRIVDG